MTILISFALVSLGACIGVFAAAMCRAASDGDRLNGTITSQQRKDTKHMGTSQPPQYVNEVNSFRMVLGDDRARFDGLLKLVLNEVEGRAFTMMQNGSGLEAYETAILTVRDELGILAP